MGGDGVNLTRHNIRPTSIDFKGVLGICFFFVCFLFKSVMKQVLAKYLLYTKEKTILVSELKTIKNLDADSLI